MPPRIMREAIEGIAERLEDDKYRMEYGEAAAQMGFAISLTFARQERGLSQQELADLLGVSKKYVVRLESGDANPSIAKAGRIFAALWLTPIDKPFPLLKGYGPYEPPREHVSGQDAAPKQPLDATDQAATKSAQAGN